MSPGHPFDVSPPPRRSSSGSGWHVSSGEIVQSIRMTERRAGNTSLLPPPPQTQTVQGSPKTEQSEGDPKERAIYHTHGRLGLRKAVITITLRCFQAVSHRWLTLVILVTSCSVSTGLSYYETLIIQSPGVNFWVAITVSFICTW